MKEKVQKVIISRCEAFFYIVASILAGGYIGIYHLIYSPIVNEYSLKEIIFLSTIGIFLVTLSAIWLKTSIRGISK